MKSMKRTKTTTPPTLCDMSDETLERIASHLEPGDVFNMVLSSKRLFRFAPGAGVGEALGLELVKRSMRRRLKRVGESSRWGFTFDDLFPEEERDLDVVSGQPQVLSLIHI